jgi:hypothetical protein
LWAVYASSRRALSLITIPHLAAPNQIRDQIRDPQAHARPPLHAGPSWPTPLTPLKWGRAPEGKGTQTDKIKISELLSPADGAGRRVSTDDCTTPNTRTWKVPDHGHSQQVGSSTGAPQSNLATKQLRSAVSGRGVGCVHGAVFSTQNRAPPDRWCSPGCQRRAQQQTV